jgi:hypothetical protein
LPLCQAVGNRVQMLDNKSQALVKGRQTIAGEVHMDFASSCTEANGVLLKAWRIALSITSGGGVNAALPSQPSNETRADRKLSSSRQWHRSWLPAQVHHESRELKVSSCRDRDKSSVDLLCGTLSLNVECLFLHKETTSPRPQNQIRRFCFRGICSYSVGYKRDFYYFLSPVHREADANGSWNTRYIQGTMCGFIITIYHRQCRRVWMLQSQIVIHSWSEWKRWWFGSPSPVLEVET